MCAHDRGVKGCKGAHSPLGPIARNRIANFFRGGIAKTAIWQFIGAGTGLQDKISHDLFDALMLQTQKIAPLFQAERFVWYGISGFRHQILNDSSAICYYDGLMAIRQIAVHDLLHVWPESRGDRQQLPFLI